MQIVTPLCVQHKYAYLNIYAHIILCLGCGVGRVWVWRISWFCGYGDSVGSPCTAALAPDQVSVPCGVGCLACSDVRGDGQLAADEERQRQEAARRRLDVEVRRHRPRGSLQAAVRALAQTDS